MLVALGCRDGTESQECWLRHALQWPARVLGSLPVQRTSVCLVSYIPERRWKIQPHIYYHEK